MTVDMPMNRMASILARVNGIGRGIRRGIGRGLLLALIGVGLAGCTALPSPPSAAHAENDTVQEVEQELVIFAASSLTDAMDALVAAFTQRTPGVTVITNFAGTSSLVTQLLEGAPADLFASANEVQMENLAQADLLQGAPQLFATNRLVIIVPADNPAAIGSLADLANPDVALVLATPGVPVRDYADELLAALRLEPAYGPNFVARVS